MTTQNEAKKPKEGTLDAIFNILRKNADELDTGEDPFAIVAQYQEVPLAFLHNVFVELGKRDKLSILWDGENIVNVFVNRGLNGARSQRRLRPNCIVLADAENVRIARRLPRHMFPGEAINQQIKDSGFAVRERFAFITTKGLEEGKVTPAEILSQVTTLAGQGFIPVVCPYVDEKEPSPDDKMLKRVVKSYYGSPDIETFLVLSGDRDFNDVRVEAEGMGHDFGVFTASSNANEDWLNLVRANIIDLSNSEQEAYGFIEKYLKEIKENSRLLNPRDNSEELAEVFLDEVIKSIAQVRGTMPFFTFRRVIWQKIPESLQKIYSEDLLARTLQLVQTHLDLIIAKPHLDTRGRQGTGFAFNRKSNDIRTLLGE